MATLHEAIIEGLMRAERHKLTKPEDISVAIQVAIDNAGLKVIRAPNRGNFDNQKPHK